MQLCVARMERPQTLKSLALLFGFIITLASPAFGWSESEVEIKGGLATLHGTMTLPKGTAPVDMALILPGSGPTDRDGNFPEGENNSLKFLAHDLAKEGIGSLRIDKRSVGASHAAAPDETDLRAETFVEDATNWLQFLEEQNRTSRIFLVGHSEGALVATLAALEHDVSGLVLIAGTGRPAPDLIREQVSGSAMPPELKTRSDELLEKLKRGETDENVPRELGPLYRPSVQPYLISWFRHDPAKELAKVNAPVLLVQGTNDLQLRPTDTALLAQARPDATLITIEAMNHVLKLAPSTRAENIALYSRPDVPLAPGLVKAIASFISDMTKKPASE